MKQFVKFLLVGLILSACDKPTEPSNQNLLGNWGYIDEDLNPLLPYTELYFDDSIYAVQNELIGTMVLNYWVVNDTIYRADGDNPKLPIGFIKSLTKDSMTLEGKIGEFTLTRINREEKGYFEYGIFNDSTNIQQYKADFEKRAINYYIAEGWFSSIDDYYEYKAEIEVNTITEDF